MGIPVFQRTFLVRTSVAHTVCRWLSYLTWPTVKGRGSPILPKTEETGKRKRTRMGAWIILFISRRRRSNRFLRFFASILGFSIFPFRFFRSSEKATPCPPEKWCLNWILLMIPTFLPVTRFSAWACRPDQLAKGLHLESGIVSRNFNHSTFIASSFLGFFVERL